MHLLLYETHLYLIQIFNYKLLSLNILFFLMTISQNDSDTKNYKTLYGFCSASKCSSYIVGFL